MEETSSPQMARIVERNIHALLTRRQKEEQAGNLPGQTATQPEVEDTGFKVSVSNSVPSPSFKVMKWVQWRHFMPPYLKDLNCLGVSPKTIVQK
jgi:hypothetical protein